MRVHFFQNGCSKTWDKVLHEPVWLCLSKKIRLRNKQRCFLQPTCLVCAPHSVPVSVPAPHWPVSSSALPFSAGCGHPAWRLFQSPVWSPWSPREPREHERKRRSTVCFFEMAKYVFVECAWFCLTSWWPNILFIIKLGSLWEAADRRNIAEEGPDAVCHLWTSCRSINCRRRRGDCWPGGQLSWQGGAHQVTCHKTVRTRKIKQVKLTA